MHPTRALFSILAATSLAATILTLTACGNSSNTTTPTADTSTPHVVAKSKEDVGRYLIKIAGCNDCHSPGGMENKLGPESDWLTGSPLGFNGPWGTSYAPNLRLKIGPYK